MENLKNKIIAPLVGLSMLGMVAGCKTTGAGALSNQEGMNEVNVNDGVGEQKNINNFDSHFIGYIIIEDYWTLCNIKTSNCNKLYKEDGRFHYLDEDGNKILIPNSIKVRIIE